MATAVYRSHCYFSKAYGNFIGLGRLMQLVARETGLAAGELTVVSTQARLERVRPIRAFLASRQRAASNCSGEPKPSGSPQQRTSWEPEIW